MDIFSRFWNWIVLDFVSNIKWDWLVGLFNHGVYWRLTDADLGEVKEKLKKDHFVILTRRKNHLTTYLIGTLQFLLTGRFGYWSHALMNIEGDDISSDQDYRLIEATGKGTHFSAVMQVFDCDSVALLVPDGVTEEEWSDVMEVALTELGLPYDTVFNLNDTSKVSCVEMVWVGIKKIPNYEARFPKLINMIKEEKNLTPQMVYDSGEFRIALEIRR